MWKWFKMLVLLAKSLCFCQYKWQEDCYHSFYQIHPSLISFLFLKNGHAFKNSEVKNCIGPEKPKVVVSANAVRWKWATVRATWQHTPQQTKKKKRLMKQRWLGGVLMSQKGVGELVKTCRYKCDTMVKLVVCCTLLCWGLLSNTDSCCELSLGSQFFPMGVFSWLIPNHDRRKCCLQIHQIVWTGNMQKKI